MYSEHNHGLNSCLCVKGAVITLGKAQKFRFNHPAEAALLRHNRLKVSLAVISEWLLGKLLHAPLGPIAFSLSQVGEALGSSCSLEWLDLDGDVTASRLGLCPVLWKER